MQPSELYRRAIVVPLDQKTEECLRAYDVTEDANVHLVKIPDDELFILLWQLGLFEEINRRCGSLIDDYEEEMVNATEIHKVLDAIDVIASAALPDTRVRGFLRELQTLAHEALRLSRPMLFVL